MIGKLWQSFLNLLYPPRCPACRTSVESHGAWCRDCLRQVWAPRHIALALHNLRWLDDCYVLCEYRAGVQTLIRNMKFRSVMRHGPHLAWLISQASLDRFGPVDAVVPVPLSAERLAVRGFNQTEAIFRPWTEAAGLMWQEALTRSRDTLPQWELTLKERRANLKGAFAVREGADLGGRRLLVVDDIFTTGITMDEAARVLKKGGAARVTGLALASGAR